jgi:hypothetical protein
MAFQPRGGFILAIWSLLIGITVVRLQKAEEDRTWYLLRGRVDALTNRVAFDPFILNNEHFYIFQSWAVRCGHSIK